MKAADGPRVATRQLLRRAECAINPPRESPDFGLKFPVAHNSPNEPSACPQTTDLSQYSVCIISDLYFIVFIYSRTRFVLLGIDLVNRGTQFLLLGTQFVLLGTLFVILGTQFVLLGTQLVLLGTQFVLLGTQPVLLGIHFVLLGTQFVLLGTQFVLLGI